MEKKPLPDSIIIRSSTARGFGDTLLASYFSTILNRNNINAFFHASNSFRDDGIYKYLDCKYIKNRRDPLYSHIEIHRVQYGYPDTNHSIIEQFCNLFCEKYDVDTNIKIDINYIPVKYEDIPEIKSVDIVLGTKCGRWCKYRQWPYFEQLKKRLEENNISYIDMDKNKMRFMDCLNCVKKSKLYVGIESGMSHYVSQVANGKALILQSGFVDINFWCNYDYGYLYIPVPCRICHKNTGNKVIDRCENDHKCMENLSVDMVFNKIVEKL